jgi:hypothetical protein
MGRSRGATGDRFRPSVAGPDRRRSAPVASSTGDPIGALLGPRKAQLRSLIDQLMEAVREEGPFEVAPKKGYLSLRRRKQFAMIKPAAAHVDLGLILPKVRPAGRLESAATFNALFTHRVRVKTLAEIDGQLQRWLHPAYVGAE